MIDQALLLVHIHAYFVKTEKTSEKEREKLTAK